MMFGTEVLVILALTLVNAFFAAAEIAVLSVRLSRLQELADEGKKAAAIAIRLRATPDQFLATVQVGITVVGATASAFGGATLEAPLARRLEALGVTTGSEQIALALVVLFVSVLSIVLGELVPKSLALRSSERISLLVARPLAALATLAKPLVWLLTQLSNLVLRPFRDSTTFTEARLSPEELQNLVEEAATAGSLAPNVGDIASRAIELGSLTVSSLLIPRQEVTTIINGASRDEIWSVLKAQSHARYPVVERDLDSTVGYVLARDIVERLVDGAPFELRSLIREVPFFVDRTPAAKALRELQASRAKLAIVVDEHGMSSGIVTIGDIAEVLLGEILDEHERPDDSIRLESSGVALVRAEAPIHEINRSLGIELPLSSDYATLSGLLMHTSSRIMRKGERLNIASADIEVVDATPRQVKLVRIRLARPPTEQQLSAPTG
jgi:putative hemolysin